MNILYITKGIIGGFLLKIFPSWGPKGVIDTQIIVYNRLKRKFPKTSENDILNSLIMSRVKASPRVASLQNEYIHYELLLQNPDKTLEDVIWEIINYEYFESRKDYLKKKIPSKTLIEARLEAKQYIKNKVTKIKNEQRLNKI